MDERETGVAPCNCGGVVKRPDGSLAAKVCNECKEAAAETPAPILVSTPAFVDFLNRERGDVLPLGDDDEEVED